MRFLYALISVWLWVCILVFLVKSNVLVTMETAILSTSIVVAGVLAGGK